MENMVNVFLFGKKYEVPSNLTIMKAMEYAGYQLVRGCGCRNGFCGACATIYRIAGDRELKACLACSTRVENNMYVATLPFFPLVKEVYDMEKLKPTQTVMMQLYPEIYACVGCNACVNICQVDILIPSPEKGKPPIVLYPGECYYCGACVMACPHDGAIRLEHPLMNRAKFVPVRYPEEK